MSELLFKKASKSLAKAKIALTGPSGSGKTMSALLLAKGLGGRVAVIDTENNSASLYEDRFPNWEYFTLPMNPPYTAQKYLKAIEAAIEQKFDVLIIDSLSHVWAAEGGLLQQKEALDSRGGNSFSNWGQITKLYEQLKSKLLHSPLHLIATMRSKQEYILEQNDKGKQAPKKVGLPPVMRDGMEYEFTVVFDIGMDHQFMVSKDRTDLFDGVVSTVTEETGKQIANWLKSEKPVDAQEAPISAPATATVQSVAQPVKTQEIAKPVEIPVSASATAAEINLPPTQYARTEYTITEKQRQRLYAISKKSKWSPQLTQAQVQKTYGKSISQLNRREYDHACSYFDVTECTEAIENNINAWTPEAGGSALDALNKQIKNPVKNYADDIGFKDSHYDK